MIDYVLAALGCIASVFTVIGFVYGMLRNFKADINSHIDRFEKRMDRFEKRMDSFESKIDMLENRMFYLATGKTLSQAILEERLKNQEGKV